MKKKRNFLIFYLTMWEIVIQFFIGRSIWSDNGDPHFRKTTSYTNNQVNIYTACFEQSKGSPRILSFCSSGIFTCRATTGFHGKSKHVINTWQYKKITVKHEIEFTAWIEMRHWICDHILYSISGL